MDSSTSKRDQEKADETLFDCPLLFNCKAMTGAIANCPNYFSCLAANPAYLSNFASRRVSPGSLVVTSDRLDRGWAIAIKLPYEYSRKKRIFTVVETQPSGGYYSAVGLPAERKKLTIRASGVLNKTIEALIVSDSAELRVCSEMIEGGWHKPILLYPCWSNLCRDLKIFVEDEVLKKAIEFHALDFHDYDCYVESIYHCGRADAVERQLYAVIHWVIFQRYDSDLHELLHFTGSLVLETKTPVDKTYFSKTHCQLSSFQPQPKLKVNSFYSKPPDWLDPDNEFFLLY